MYKEIIIEYANQVETGDFLPFYEVVIKSSKEVVGPFLLKRMAADFVAQGHYGIGEVKVVKKSLPQHGDLHTLIKSLSLFLSENNHLSKNVSDDLYKCGVFD